MNDNLTSEQQELVAQIVAEAERQLAELYDSPEAREALAKSGEDDRSARVVLARQIATIKEFLNRDVDDVLREITPKLGIRQENHPVYQTWENVCEVAKAPLTGYLVGLFGVTNPTAAASATLAAIVVIVSFYGLDKFCDRYGSNS